MHLEVLPKIASIVFLYKALKRGSITEETLLANKLILPITMKSVLLVIWINALLYY